MIFGEFESGVVYSMRPGAYAVLTDSQDRVAVVEVMGHWHLPGGGIHAGESAEEALRRELLEEVGIEPLAISEAVTSTDLLNPRSAEDRYIIDGYYFRVGEYRHVGRPREADHQLHWVDRHAATEKLVREGQAWALRQLLAESGEGVQGSLLPKPKTENSGEGGSKDFWSAVDELVANGDIVVDRPRGSSHPRYPDFHYPLNYGFVRDTRSPDGNELDVWVGSLPDKRCVGVVCTVDLLKRDSEIKLLLGCTREEICLVMRVHNRSSMSGLLMTRRQN